ncbi:STM3941 family protein [Puia sp.]|jgi:hypothetical protein|uniref:STM3941 family protein n=1 Tax=Puia sp. TaxID=2045100 RepID=UPI002F3FD664
MPTSETIIPFSKAKLPKLLLLSVGCILLGLFFVIVQPSGPGLLFTVPALVIIIGSFIIIGGFLLGTLYFRQILKNGPALIIDNSGFTDYSSGLAAGYIPWAEVKGLKTVSLPRYKKKFIAVILKNPNAFLDSQPNALKRKAMTVNFRNYGSPIQLSPNSLECSFDELQHHLQTYFDRSRPAVLN